MSKSKLPFNKETFVKALNESSSIREVMLKINNGKKRYHQFYKALKEFNIELQQYLDKGFDESVYEAPTSYTKEELQKAVQVSKNISEVLIKLGLVARGSSYKGLYFNMTKYKIDFSHLTEQKGFKYDPECFVNNKGKRDAITDEQFIKAVADNISYQSIITFFKLSNNSGANDRWVRDKIKELDLDISHFKGRAYLKGKSNQFSKKTPLKDILVKDSFYSTGSLKRRLIAEKLLEYKCYMEGCCLTEEWNGKKLVLQIDHINGDHTDNRLENLRLLCPNCHSQTDTFCSKNIKIQKENKEKELL